MTTRFHKVSLLSGDGVTSRPVDIRPPTDCQAADWHGGEFELDKPRWSDYLTARFGFRLCSPRLRDAVTQSLGPLDRVQWLDAWVSNGRERRQYFGLHFPACPEVLDRKLTTFVRGTDHIIQAVLDWRLIADRHLFQASPYHLVVSDEARRRIDGAGCNGIEYEAIVVSHVPKPSVAGRVPSGMKRLESPMPDAPVAPGPGTRNIDALLGAMRPMIRARSWAELEAEYLRRCKVEALETATKIAAVDLSGYEGQLAELLVRAAAAAERTRPKSAYWEFDVDNRWSSAFFACASYRREAEDGDDDWASDFDEEDVVVGPASAELAAFYASSWNRSPADTAVNAFLIARTLAAFGRAAEIAWRSRVPLCAGHHDQSVVFRVEEA